MNDLDAFNTGFIDGIKGNARQKNLGSTYLKAFAKGKQAKEDAEAGGPDMGESALSRPRTRKRDVAIVA